MSSNLFSDIGLIFFVSWSFVLARLSIAAFGRDLVPSQIRRLSKQLPPDEIGSSQHGR